MLHMGQPTKIHMNKQPIRIHYIKEWAAKRNLKQKDIVHQIGVDKGTVSRWFKGSLPTEQHLIALAHLFGTDVPGLFRDPDDDWLARFFKERSEEEKRRASQVLEAAFPKSGTGD